MKRFAGVWVLSELILDHCVGAAAFGSFQLMPSLSRWLHGLQKQMRCGCW
jgi:hypothetical protein